MRPAITLILALLLALPAAAAPVVERGPSPAYRVLRRGMRMVRKGQKLRPRMPAQEEHNPDASFEGRHPNFRRLVNEGWYAKKAEIKPLRALGAKLENTRTLFRNSKVEKGEYLVFDLEATGLLAGAATPKGFVAGWDDIVQFGYAVVKDERVIKEGKIAIRPDVPMTPGALEATKLTEAEVAKGMPFEHAAKEILQLMQNRIIVGHNAKSMDWSWLRSALARAGVDIPSPEGIVLDSMLIAANVPNRRYGLDKLAEEHGVVNPHAHDAQADAVTTAAVFIAELKKQGIRTVAEAFAAQDKGQQAWETLVAKIQKTRAERAAKKAAKAAAAQEAAAAQQQ